MNKEKQLRIFDILLIVTFIIGLFLPLVMTHNQDISPIEQRKLASLPELKWNRKVVTGFPSQFQTFFNDHFGFRDNLSQIYYLFSVMLKSSPNPAVLVGKDGWLFLAYPVIQDYRKNDPLTPAELANWKFVLEAKYTWLKQRGIQYLFMIAPDKHSIYGEYIPSRIHQVGRQSRLDQLLEYMHDSEVPILDLRPPLLQAKSKGLLYYKTDSHWNDLGAAVAQYEIMRYLRKYFPTLHPIDYSVADFSLGEFKSGGEAKMLNLASQLKEMAPELRKPLPQCNFESLEQAPDNPSKAFFTNCRSDGPKALIFRDSFFTALQPYTSQYLSKSLYVWISLDPYWPDFDQLEYYLEHLARDIVIEERVERHLKFVPTLRAPRNKAHQAFFENLLQMGEVVYRLTPHHEDELIGRHQLTITPVEQGYTLISHGNDPYFYLPEFKSGEGKQYIIKIDLNAPEATNWQIFYGAHYIFGQLEAGENTLYAVIGQGQIRVDPGSVMGKYVLKSLEIRAMKGQGS